MDLAVSERIGRSAVEALATDGAAATTEAAVSVLNEALLPAMKEVGDKFGAGELLILPFVLQSAEVMKGAVARMETYLEKQEGYTKGKVVLATVFGDVHDIGKNLVNTILANNGYTVFDLGKQVPLNTIIDKAVEVGADAIGLSALLVSTSKQMPACVKELHHRGLEFPVIIGGAAINRGFGRRLFVVRGDALFAGVSLRAGCVRGFAHHGCALGAGAAGRVPAADHRRGVRGAGAAGAAGGVAGGGRGGGDSRRGRAFQARRCRCRRRRSGACGRCGPRRRRSIRCSI